MVKAENLRATPRLSRRESDSWQLYINNDELITRNVVDVSPQGLSFKAPSRSQFVPGQTLKIEVRLAPEKHFETEAKVVWARDNHFGLKLSKVPQFIDAFIMKTLQEIAIKSQEFVDNAGIRHPLFEREPVAKALRVLRRSQKTIESNEVISSAMALFTVAAMTAALVLAAYMHQQKFPEDKLSNIGQSFFQRFINGPGK